MYNGNLHGQWEAIVTLQQMVILSDYNDILSMSKEDISNKTSIPVHIIEKGIAILSSPDNLSNHAETYGGREIINLNSRTEPVWLVVNASIYKVRKTPSIWNRIRNIVFQRDNYTCQYCGRTGVALHCDHVFAKSRGGSDNIDNLKTACAYCNLSKGAKDVNEWKMGRLFNEMV